jgi:hypothetical protein
MQKYGQTIVNPIYTHYPMVVNYDTVDGIFFYENSIEAYIDHHVVVKNYGFVFGDSVNEKLYQNEYYIIAEDYYLNALQKMALDVRVNQSSISLFYDSLRTKGIRDGSFWSETEINPFCGGYYKKYMIKMEVLYIDNITQRVPVFIDCNERLVNTRRTRRDYKMSSIPTYVITDIMFWKELR